jgi:hypothetical protein
MCVAIEGSYNDFEYILGEGQALRKNSIKFRWLFSHHEKYILGHVILKGEGDNIDFDPCV